MEPCTKLHDKRLTTEADQSRNEWGGTQFLEALLIPYPSLPSEVAPCRYLPDDNLQVYQS